MLRSIRRRWSSQRVWRDYCHRKFTTAVGTDVSVMSQSARDRTVPRRAGTSAKYAKHLLSNTIQHHKTQSDLVFIRLRIKRLGVRVPSGAPQKYGPWWDDSDYEDLTGAVRSSGVFAPCIRVVSVAVGGRHGVEVLRPIALGRVGTEPTRPAPSRATHATSSTSDGCFAPNRHRDSVISVSVGPWQERRDRTFSRRRRQPPSG